MTAMTDPRSPQTPRRTAAKKTTPARPATTAPVTDSVADTVKAVAAGELLDPRYAHVVAELRDRCSVALEAMVRAGTPDVQATFREHWGTLIEPRLVVVLSTFAGPPTRPVEACTAYHYAGKRDEKDWNVCDGQAESAVVKRVGDPQSPGRIVKHLPGCAKHARAAMSFLNVGQQELQQNEPWATTHWLQMMPLAEARLELRVQEMDDAIRPARRRWWQLWR
jgi:hypothetical protein